MNISGLNMFKIAHFISPIWYWTYCNSVHNATEQIHIFQSWSLLLLNPRNDDIRFLWNLASQFVCHMKRGLTLTHFPLGLHDTSVRRKQYVNRATYNGHARRAIGATWFLRSSKDASKKRSRGLLAIWPSSARCSRRWTAVYPLPATPAATTWETAFKAAEKTRNFGASSTSLIPSVTTTTTWGEIRQSWLAMKDLTRTISVTLHSTQCFRFLFLFLFFSRVFSHVFVYNFFPRLI